MKRLGICGKLAILGVWWVGAGVAAAQSEAAALTQTNDNIVVVELRQSSSVDHRAVSIDGLAVLRGGEPGLRQQIGRLDVAEFTQTGKTVVVSRDQVAYRIQLAGIDPSRFRVDGPAQAMITLATVEYSEADVIKAAQDAITERLGANSDDVQFHLAQPVHLPAMPAAPAGELKFVPDLRTQGKPLGRVRVEVGIVVEREMVATVPVTLDVACFQQVAVALRRLDNGETLQREDIRAEKRLVHGGENVVAFADSLFGQHTLHVLPAGQALTSGDIELTAAADPVLVKSRDNVKLLAIVGNLHVSAFGEALQDGRNGQMVRVRNIDSNRIVVGRVIGRDVVEVEH